MLIANPIYDSVFKFLMEDPLIARRFLSAIIGEEIVELTVQSQEQSAPSNKYMLTIFRLDFKAIIRTQSGEQKKVLIELQKSKNAFDLLRFRHYLGSNYIRNDEVDGVKMPLPVLPIYFLGFPLSIDSAVLKVNRQYQDVGTGKIFDTKDEFIEHLSHDCFVVQIRRLPEKTQTKLEKLLSFFNQKWVFDSDQKWLLKYPESVDDEDQRLILNRLAYAAESEDMKEQIEVEETFDNSMDTALREKELVIARKDEVINQKEAALNEAKRLAEQAQKEREELLQRIAALEQQNRS